MTEGDNKEKVEREVIVEREGRDSGAGWVIAVVVIIVLLIILLFGGVFRGGSGSTTPSATPSAPTQTK